MSFIGPIWPEQPQSHSMCHQWVGQCEAPHTRALFQTYSTEERGKGTNKNVFFPPIPCPVLQIYHYEFLLLMSKNIIIPTFPHTKILKSGFENVPKPKRWFLVPVFKNYTPVKRDSGSPLAEYKSNATFKSTFLSSFTDRRRKLMGL